MNELRTALIGCGVIGERRLQVIEKTGLGRIIGVYDIARARAELLADRFRTRAVDSPSHLLQSGEVDIVILATPNHGFMEYGTQALANGKHALLEKPGATSSAEVTALLNAARESGKQPRCKIGYNHRFHPAALRMHEELSSGRHGSIAWIRGAYGHGGRPGYEKEWRFQKALSGGGEIIDQGVHLLDLVRWWSGKDLALAHASRQSAFYRSSEEDNGFLLLTNREGIHAQLHCSVTQWKNLFRMEVGTTESLLIWEGLGNKNYGPETLTIHRRNPAGGAPTTEKLTFDQEAGADGSWELEWRHFCSSLGDRSLPLWSALEESQWIFGILDETHREEVIAVERHV